MSFHSIPRVATLARTMAGAAMRIVAGAAERIAAGAAEHIAARAVERIAAGHLAPAGIAATEPYQVATERIRR